MREEATTKYHFLVLIKMFPRAEKKAEVGKQKSQTDTLPRGLFPPKKERHTTHHRTTVYILVSQPLTYSYRKPLKSTRKEKFIEYVRQWLPNFSCI